MTKDGHIYDENTIKFYSESVFGNVLVRNTEIKKLTKNIQNLKPNLILKMKNNNLISEIELLEKSISSNELK